MLSGGGPWGFTLTGGKDFGSHLQVMKVLLYMYIYIYVIISSCNTLISIYITCIHLTSFDVYTAWIFIPWTQTHTNITFSISLHKSS